MISKDSLGDRQKNYESQTVQHLMPLVPIICRVDGRAFSTFTKGLERPFDTNLSNLMVETTKFLVQETNAKIGYTQSDEISLVWYNTEIGTESFFDGKVLKMVSVIASMATAVFNRFLPEHLPNKATKLAFFDARVFNVPTDWEATNYLIWREMDATRNSISMAAQAKFSHNQLHKKNCAQMQEMLFQNYGINWNDYPSAQKRGTYVQKREVVYVDNNAGTSYARKRMQILDIPPLKKIANREGVVFRYEDPILKSELEVFDEEPESA